MSFLIGGNSRWVKLFDSFWFRRPDIGVCLFYEVSILSNTRYRSCSFKTDIPKHIINEKFLWLQWCCMLNFNIVITFHSCRFFKASNHFLMVHYIFYCLYYEKMDIILYWTTKIFNTFILIFRFFFFSFCSYLLLGKSKVKERIRLSGRQLLFNLHVSQFRVTHTTHTYVCM